MKKQGCVQGYQSRVRVGRGNDRKGLTIAIEKKNGTPFCSKEGQNRIFFIHSHALFNRLELE